MDSNDARKINSYIVLLGVGVAAIIAVLVILWWDVVHKPYLQDDFSYNAGTVSTETIYENDGKTVDATRYLINNLELRFANNDSTHLKTSYNSTSTNNTPFFDKERLLRVDSSRGRYIIDGKTGPHVLGPRGIRQGISFSYMHPKYPAVAEMNYVSTQTIDGILTYKYQSTYPTTRLPAKEPNAHLNKHEKLAYDPSIQLWIEPKSGWLIKYEDNSAIYRYDTKTGERGALYASIAERTSGISVSQNAAYALSLQRRMTFASQAAPSLLFAIFLSIGLVVVIGNMRRKVIPVYGSILLAAVTSFAALAGWFIAATPLIAPFGDAGMNPLTAICFLLVALAIAALRSDKRAYVALLGGVVGIFSLLQIFGELQALPFSIDLLFFGRSILALSETVPSRMSLYVAFTLLVLSVCLIKAGFSSTKSEVHFAKFMAGVVITLGIFGLLLRTMQIDQLFTVPFVESVSFVTSLMFIVLGFALLQQFRMIHGKKSDIRSIIKSLRYPAMATVPLVVIGTFAQIQQTAITTKIETSFNESTNNFETALDNKIGLIASSLQGTAAFIGSSDTATEQEFQQYTQSILTTFKAKGDSSLRTIGYAERINNTDALVRFVQPNNIPIYKQGYNLAKDEPYKVVLSQAATTKSTFMTSPLSLGDNQSATALVTAVTDKQSRIIGYVFGVIDINELASRATVSLGGDIEFEIYDDIQVDASPQLYDSSREPHALQPRIASKNTVFLNHHPWTIIYAAEPSFQLSPQEEYSPTVVLLGGTLSYFGVITILYFLIDLERRARLAKKIKRLRRKK